MRSPVRTSLTLIALAAFVFCSGDVWAKGGRGGGGGKRGGGKVSRSSFPSHGGSHGGKRWTDASPAGKHQPSNKSFSQPKNPRDFANSTNQPWDRHQLREQRKLDHSQKVANHLRQVSDQNGNEQLKQVADDMDQRSQAHYDQQMEKIRQKYGLEDSFGQPGDMPASPLDESLGDAGSSLGGGNDAVSDVAQKLTGRENALARQLRNEQRKLDKRLGMVDQMREVASANGDQAMLDNADRLEEWANNHFDQRMEQITDFQDRHGLSAISEPIAP